VSVKKLTCPECVQGKHQNCTGWAIDEATDKFEPCACRAKGHGS
jgi:hypothetical protein